jgi:hypothetical protein
MTYKTHKNNNDSKVDHTVRNCALAGFILGTTMGPAGSVVGLVTGVTIGAGVSTVKSIGSGIRNSGFFARKEMHSATPVSSKHEVLDNKLI